MTYIQAFIIAIIEGLTEFLPISSTAHMKIANPFLQVAETPFTNLFEVVIQLAAILSVVVVYWKKFFDFKNFNLYIKLIIAVIPALILGALLKKHIDSALSNLTFIACVMIIGGIVLLFIDKLFTTNNLDEEVKISYTKAFLIGCFQTLSILLPGLSRSAATIIGGMSQKLTRRLAAEFSFFLAVPTMFAATAKSLLDERDLIMNSLDQIWLLLLGNAIAFVVAYFAMNGFVNYLNKNGFKVFGYYRIALGLTILTLIQMGVDLKIVD